jgi:hypothetical protein
MGDLMMIFTKKFYPDGTFEKYKCRIVFRGDRWTNLLHHSTYSSSMDDDAFKLLLATAATEDLDIFSVDVKTAFLYGTFPDGMRQWVRSPHGLPSNFLPHRFELLKSAYGHPLANQRFEAFNIEHLIRIGFKPLLSTPSVYIIERDGERLTLGSITDDFVMTCVYGSPIKAYVLAELGKVYTLTHKDPLTNFVGMHLERDRANRTIKLSQPKFLNEMKVKYPLPEGDICPTTPMAAITTSLSKQDRHLQQQYLTPAETKDLQTCLGDALWVTSHTRPDGIYATNIASRYGTRPTAYHLKVAFRILYYLIGTAHLTLNIGGPGGLRMFATVDTSYAMHNDLKSHSCWTLHMSTGGAFLSRTKKQSINTDSSTYSELVGAHLSLRDIQWARNFLREIGYDKLSPTVLFIDNQSTLNIIAKRTHSGKTKHVNVRYKMITQIVDNGELVCKHLPTHLMIADIGTKPLSPQPFLALRDYQLGYSTLPQVMAQLYPNCAKLSAAPKQ